MGKIPNELREIIADNIRKCRLRKYPGRGGGKKCAEAFGVSPQQWSPWERGMRTPDEERMENIARFFDVSVAYLRQDRRDRTLSGSPIDGDTCPQPNAGELPESFSLPPPFSGASHNTSQSLFDDLPQIGISPRPDELPPIKTPQSDTDTYWLLAKFFAGVSQDGVLIRLAKQDMDNLGECVAQALVRNGVVFPTRG